MDFFVVGIIGFAISALSVPLAIFIAKRFELVDDPKKRPHPAHVQSRVIPRAGGIPIYISVVLTSLLFLPVEKHLIGMLAGSTILLILGLLDDKLIKFSPYVRLPLLFATAGLAVGSGIGISFLPNPLYGLHINNWPQFIPLTQLVVPFDFFGPHTIVVLADILALVWIVTCMQIINWSKGVDGQMPGITLVAALTLGIVSYKFYILGDPNQASLAKLAFIVAGSSLGLLIFNWHPSRIIPGFSASTILAFLLACLSILSGAKLATAILVLGIPTADFVYTIIRRLASGKSPVWGDRGHLHHRLLDIGWSHQSISLFYILASVILGTSALLLSSEGKLFALLLTASLFVMIILWLNHTYKRKQKTK
jgi:UDP-GlcNAc:undecaprenyl-phosphate/decaprenyl-phosphate GlcNAc-1-phosphate transferase